jgi:hypothetical protein
MRKGSYVFVLTIIVLPLNRGEWHTYPDNNLLSDETKNKVYLWYRNAFKITKLQMRDPFDAPGGGIGFHDDSFAYSTVSILVEGRKSLPHVLTSVFFYLRFYR